MRTKIEEIEARFGSGDIWNDPEAARKLNEELSSYKGIADKWGSIADRLEEIEMFAEMASPDNEAEAAEVDNLYNELMRDLEHMETRALMSGEFDKYDAILTVHAGAGGVDAQDWTEMLLRMYLRWAENEGFKADVADISPAEEDGIHSATAIIRGPMAFGMLSSERGVHRLVRISPYDAAKRRHTSFAKVEVVPDISDDIKIDIRPEDLKVDTYRSQGAGGQHVNKTESAIRITHIPTGIIVACQNERSQHSNRETAMRMLRARLYEMQEAERRGVLDSAKGENREAAWANQIRNYVLQPYTMVKDRRTGCECGNVQGVLDGDLNKFMIAWLEARAQLGREPSASDSGSLD